MQSDTCIGCTGQGCHSCARCYSFPPRGFNGSSIGFRKVCRVITTTCPFHSSAALLDPQSVVYSPHMWASTASLFLLSLWPFYFYCGTSPPISDTSKSSGCLFVCSLPNPAIPLEVELCGELVATFQSCSDECGAFSPAGSWKGPLCVMLGRFSLLVKGATTLRPNFKLRCPVLCGLEPRLSVPSLPRCHFLRWFLW